VQYKKRYGCSKGKLMGRGGYFFVALSLRYDIGMPSEWYLVFICRKMGCLSAKKDAQIFCEFGRF